jgi:hypothetical protein
MFICPRARRPIIGWVLGIGLFCVGLATVAQPVSGQPSASVGGKTKIVFVAGPPSHKYSVHEYNAGCELLASCLRENVPGVEAVVSRNGWPKEPAIFDGVAAIVFYADGLERHPILGHLDEIDRLAKHGVGLAFLHYALLLPNGKPSDDLRDWTGGCYEMNWSVNPYWTAEFHGLPTHPVTRGVKPFAIHDEWYYHMRFLPDMGSVTPLLTATPPESTRQGPDGPHSGNPHVRARKGMAEHLAWVRERPDGGRGFGFTGGDSHWNWAQNDYRTFVLNGIVWTAKLDIPPGGVASKTPSLSDLEVNQDKPQPADFDRAKIQKMIEQWRE